LKDSISILNSLSKEGYSSAALEKRIKEMEEWLSHPTLLNKDDDAEYADTIDIDLSEIREPLLACPMILITLSPL